MSRIVTRDSLAGLLQEIEHLIARGRDLGLRIRVPTKENVVIVIHDHDTGLTDVSYGKNIVTDDGDIYYAQRTCGETPTNTYIGARMGSNIAGGTSKTDTDVNSFFGVGKATTATYPKTNDGDPLNTLAGVNIVTWKFEWATSENVGAQDEIAIVDNLTTPTTALCHADCGLQNKTNLQSMIVYVNHVFEGIG